MSFQKIILSIAVFILLFSLCVVFFFIFKARGNSVYPPFVSQCPDFWNFRQDKNCFDANHIIPETIVNKNGCERLMDFNEPKFQGKLGMQYKYNWAKQCQTPWDGITNNEKLALS